MPLPRDIFAKTDSTVTKALVFKGLRKAQINEPVRQVQAQLARKGHSLVAEYVSGVTNRADKPSSTVTTRKDLTIADDHNHHLPHYWTYFPSPHASGTDAMAQVWHRGQLLHINPPWGMIPRILAKLKNDKARAVIVAPRWQSAWWWPTLE